VMVKLKLMIYPFRFRGQTRWMLAWINKHGRERFYGGISYKTREDAERAKYLFERGLEVKEYERNSNV